MADMSAYAGLATGGRFRARGWLVFDPARAASYLTPFRPSKVFVWDDRFLPLRLDEVAKTELAFLEGCVEVEGFWDGEALLVSRWDEDAAVDPAVASLRVLAQRVREAFVHTHEEHPDFEAFAATLGKHPSVLAMTHIALAEYGRVYVLSSPEPERVEALVAQGPAGPVVVFPSRWNEAQLEDARALVDSVPADQVLKIGEATTDRGERYAHALVTQLPDGFEAARDLLPEGIVDVRPWIEHVSGPITSPDALDNGSPLG
ncbi:hypothetical protein [Pseudoclavibacter sp. VKM Ac-2867]|uniref:hypothetical protein n=1 Tax=Pseudoclavibacter sp. VKM Ac-2867 TaxID=2783829 RepID=UPI00188AA8C8|nr:hypothetical protein [Pseudoclavibacter sp. VKM Ac-2867]MBF4457958.1 hypothetical protein [Pseudoclavibacter sp. VKM Ac-2867]